MHYRRLLAAVAAVAAASLSACGGGSDNSYGNGPTSPGNTNPGGTTTGVNTNNVVIADQSFNPGVVNVPVGTTVTWEWKACSDDGYGGYSGCVAHNVTFDDGSNIASSTQSAGTFTRTFNAAGTYKYHCTIHGAPMSGQVTVK
jgi:plastocyanin